MTTKYNFAAIDIGSNAVRLLIKGIHEGETLNDLSKLFIVRVPLRLGQDTFTTGNISVEKAEKLNDTIEAFKLLMKVYNVRSYRACATSAMREAENGINVAAQISKKTGVEISVIKGEEEARIISDSRIIDTIKPKGNYIFVDVGGGSTEMSVISERQVVESKSYRIGTVRTLHHSVDKDETNRLLDDVSLLSSQYKKLSIIGSGGNINKLNKLADVSHGKPLKTNKLIEITNWLKSKTIEERIEQIGLKPDRADVIIPAAEIFINIAQCANIKNIWVPTIGIVDGIVYTLCEEYLENISS